MVVVVVEAGTVVVVVPRAAAPPPAVTPSSDPATSSVTFWPVRLESGTSVTGPLSTDAERRSRLGPRGPVEDLRRATALDRRGRVADAAHGEMLRRAAPSAVECAMPDTADAFSTCTSTRLCASVGTVVVVVVVVVVGGWRDALGGAAPRFLKPSSISEA